MLLECDVAWSGIQVEGVVYMRRADGLFEVNNPAHAQILLSSPRWTEKPKGTFKEVAPTAPPPAKAAKVEAKPELKAEPQEEVEK